MITIDPVRLYKTKSHAKPTLELVAYYAMEGNGNDSHINGYNGTTANVTSIAGKVNNALNFDGTSSYISLPAIMMADLTGDVSMSCWVKVTTWANYRTLFHFVSRANLIEIDVSIKNTGVISMDDGRNFLYTGTTVIPTGVWTNVCISFHNDGLNSTFEVFINSISEGITTIAYNPNLADDFYRIGQHIGQNWEMYGGLDEMAFYNRTLSQEDVNWIYNGGNGRSYNEY